MNEITALGEAFGEVLTAERQVIYVRALADIPKDKLRLAIEAAVKELKWFPKVAELRELAGALSSSLNGGRPGPEEAWARMPKGERMEEDSIVWCEEERIAYGACRSLLLDGDLIAARMAFRERYKKELAEACAQGKPIRWIVSAGYDIENRLMTLSTAVEQKRIDPQYALNFVPGERYGDFANLLPSAFVKGLLPGAVRTSCNLPGLAGLLANMQMENLIPDGLKPEPESPYPAQSIISSDDRRSRIKELREQANLLLHSRDGEGTGAA